MHEEPKIWIVNEFITPALNRSSSTLVKQQGEIFIGDLSKINN